MNKIKEAQRLADKILDECGCDGDQEKVAFQKDTLFDNPERIVKDRTDDEPSLNPEPNTEGMINSLANRFKTENDSINASKVYSAQQEQSKKEKMANDIVRKIFMKKKKSNSKDLHAISDSKIVEGLTDWIKKKKEAIDSGKVKGGVMGALSARQKAMKDAMSGT